MKPFSKRYCALALEFAYSHFKLKDQSTFLGFLWSFLHPLLILFVFLVFFREKVGREIEHYGIFLLIGILHYTHFANSTSASMMSLSGMRQVTRNVILRKELLVFGTLLSFTVEFLISMVICILIAIAAGVKVSLAIASFPLIFVLQVLTISWLSLLLAVSYVFLRDISHVYQVFLRILLFITPVFYPASFLGTGPAKYVVLFNPLAQAIEFSRSILLHRTFPPFEKFLLWVAILVVLNFVSYLIFKKFEPAFSEHA